MFFSTQVMLLFKFNVVFFIFKVDFSELQVDQYKLFIFLDINREVGFSFPKIFFIVLSNIVQMTLLGNEINNLTILHSFMKYRRVVVLNFLKVSSMQPQEIQLL